MSVVLEEQAIRQLYRVVSDPSWQVQTLHRGKWVTGYYCSSEDGAYQRLDKCVKRALEFSKLSREEQIQSILR